MVNLISFFIFTLIFSEYSRIMFKNIDFNLQHCLYKINSPRNQATFFESFKMLSKLSKNVLEFSLQNLLVGVLLMMLLKKLGNIWATLRFIFLCAAIDLTYDEKIGNVCNFFYFHHIDYLVLDENSTLNIFKLTSNKPYLEEVQLYFSEELLELTNLTKLITLLEQLPKLEMLHFKHFNPPIRWKKLFVRRFKSLETLAILTEFFKNPCFDLKNF